MTDPVLAAANRLADVLEQENAALAVLDLAGAAGLLADKQQAVQRFVAAGQSAQAGGTAVRQLTRLRDVADRNRRLLERAIAVQGQVIGVIAAALPRPTSAGRYAASGAPSRSGSMAAFALLTRV